MFLMPPAQRVLDTAVSEIEDSSLLDLIAELSEVTRVPVIDRRSVFSFLSQTLYPAGSGKRYKLEKDLLNPAKGLVRKVTSFRGTLVFQVCEELAQMQNQSAEVAENKSLYVFLNDYLPNYEKKAKPRGYDPRQWR